MTNNFKPFRFFRSSDFELLCPDALPISKDIKPLIYEGETCNIVIARLEDGLCVELKAYNPETYEDDFGCWKYFNDFDSAFNFAKGLIYIADRSYDEVLDAIKSGEIVGVDGTYGIDKLNEDTVKKSSGKWVNRGDTGKEHGEFKTKKAADAQRKAMFARGYKAESLEEDTWEDEHYKRWQKSDIDHVKSLLGKWVEITIDDYSLVVSIPKTEYINSGIINITGSFFETLKDYVEKKYEGYTLWSNNMNNYFHIVIDKKRNKTENLNEDVDIKTWNDAYAFFGDIVNKYFDGTPESIETVNDEVTKLYLEHQGEEPFETAWKKWNDPYDGLDESLLKESLPKELEELFDGESYVVGWFDEDHNLIDYESYEDSDDAYDNALEGLDDMDDYSCTAEIYDPDGELEYTYDEEDLRHYYGRDDDEDEDLDESLPNKSDVEDPEIRNPHFNWLDNDTFVMTFDGGIDEDGDEFIYDAEYWKDKDSYHFIKVFDDDNMLANFSDDKKNEIIKMMQDKMIELDKSSIE